MTRTATPPEALRASGKASATLDGAPLSPEEVRRLDAYWRATLYLSLGMIYFEELTELFRGYGYTPYLVEGSEPESMHQAMAATLEHCLLEISVAGAHVRDQLLNRQIDCLNYAHENGIDPPEIVNWKWQL